MTILSTLQPQSEAITPGAHQTIVVVDDDASICEMLQLMIEAETSHQTVCLSSGKETLQRIEEIQAAHPALFVLDLMLPSMTGFQLSDALQCHPALQGVPALMLTAALPTPAMKAALAERGLSVLSQPFDITELVGCIKHKLLEQALREPPG